MTGRAPHGHCPNLYLLVREQLLPIDYGAVRQRTGARDRWVHVDNALDALIVGYYEGDKLMFASKVRNRVCASLLSRGMGEVEAPATDACPFTNLPERKRTQWALMREQM